MPNGIYPVPPLHSRENDGRAPASRPGLPLRLRTWWRRNRLDEQLANGIDPRTNAQLTLRAQQLVTTVGRARLADDLDGVLRQGRGQAPQIHRLVRRGQVRACSDALAALALRLRDDQAVDPRGAAMVSRLLSDGRSPLYHARANEPLPEALRNARRTLEKPDQSVAPAFRAAA